MRSRGIVALLACLFVATCSYALTLHDPDMTSWELLWFRGANAAFVPRWWHGVGWPALLLGPPTVLLTGLAMFGLSRAVRRLCGQGRHNPGVEADRNA